MFRSLSLLAALLSAWAVYGLPTDDCPIQGPTFIPAPGFANSEAFKNVTSRFNESMQALFDAGAVNDTLATFALDVWSTETNGSIFSYYHAGSGLKGLTVPEPDDDTIFRIGSVTKLFTAYAVLAAAGLEVMNHPVTQHLPELAGNKDSSSAIGSIIWEDITVGALMAHQAGTGGVPIESVLCYVSQSEQCPVSEFLAQMKAQKRPTMPAWTTVIYSDAGYATLGRVLERVSGLKYEDALKRFVLEPLGLNSSSASLPPTEGLNAMALEGTLAESSWGLDSNISAPSGGVYSSAADLRALGLSILHSEILDPVVTREWMKPRALTSSLANSVGAPWEINRLALPVSSGSSRTRYSDLYTKAGGQAGYGTVIAMSPDHGIGFSVLTAGPLSSLDRFVLRDLLGELFIPAAEHAAMANPADNFAGLYADPNSENTNLTLSVDPDRAGLGLDSWFVEGVEWRANLTAIAGTTPTANLSVRLYPNGLSDGNDMGYWGVPQVTPFSPRSVLEGGLGLFENSCETWQSLGFWTLNGTYPDEFVFTIEDGKLKSIFNPTSQSTMERVE